MVNDAVKMKLCFTRLKNCNLCYKVCSYDLQDSLMVTFTIKRVAMFYKTH